MKAKPHITRKRLEQDSAYGELTLKIEHGIRSYLHGVVDYEVLDDLVQTTWLRLLALPEDKRTPQKAYNCGRRAAERHWQKSITEKARTFDPVVETEDGTVNLLDNMEAPYKEPHIEVPDSFTLRSWLDVVGTGAIGPEDYEWLLTYVDRRGFKPKADEVRAKGLLSLLECALADRGV